METKVKKFNWLVNYIEVEDMNHEILKIFVKTDPINIKKIPKLNSSIVNFLFEANNDIIDHLECKWKKTLLPENIIKNPSKIKFIPRSANLFNKIYFENKSLIDYFPKVQQKRIKELKTINRDTKITNKLFLKLIKYYL